MAKVQNFFNSRNAQKKYLAANAIFLSTKHDDKILDDYFNILDDIFKKISNFENGSLSIDKYLDGPVCQSGFQD